MTQYHGPKLKPLGVMAKSCFSCFRLYWNDHTWFIFIYFQTKRFPSKLLGLKWCPEARGSSHVKKFEFWNFHHLGAVPPLPDWLWQCHLRKALFYLQLQLSICSTKPNSFYFLSFWILPIHTMEGHLQDRCRRNLTREVLMFWIRSL